MSDPALLAPAAPAISLTHPPFVAGRVVGTAFRVFGRNALAFCLVTVVFLAPGIVLAVATRDESTALSMILWNVLECFATAAVVRGALEALDGRPVRLRTLFAAGVGNGFRIFGVSIMTGIIIVLGLVALVIPGLVAAAGLYLAGAAVVAEGISAGTSVERSWNLTRGHRAAMLGIFLLFLLFPVGMSFLVSGAWIPLVRVIGAQTAMVLGNLLLAATLALPPVAAAAAFRDVRAEKEGLPASDLGAVFE